MHSSPSLYHQTFFTATIYKWISVLQYEECKQIIVDSLNFLVEKKRVRVFAFVIMPNHIHLIWQIQEGHSKENVQRDFLKFTGQQIKFYLEKNDNNLLKQLEVNLKDRKYQIWQRNALSIPIWTPKVLEQKLNYIHLNPIQEKWKLCTYPEEYKFSSARFYFENKTMFSFLCHYLD
jgi:putative transposase